MKINGTDFGPVKLDFKESISRRQNRYLMGNGTVRVRSVLPEDEIVTVTLPRLTTSQKDALVALIETADFAANTVTVEDDYGNVYTARVWSNKVQFTHRLGDYWTVTLDFRVEN